MFLSKENHHRIFDEAKVRHPRARSGPMTRTTPATPTSPSAPESSAVPATPAAPAPAAAVSPGAPDTAAGPGSRRWLALVFISLAQLMVALDATPRSSPPQCSPCS